MGCSVETRVVLALALAGAALACTSDPSKSDALAALERDAPADATCTLPIDVLSTLKMQYATKAACVPKEQATTARVTGCMEALASAGVTRPMPAGYMREWPDDIAAKSLSEVPAYERKARDLLYASCWSIDDRLRQGQFKCATAAPAKVLEIKKTDDAHADVKVAQTITPIDALAAIDRACAGVTKPPSDVTVRLEKISTGWTVAATTTPLVTH